MRVTLLEGKNGGLIARLNGWIVILDSPQEHVAGDEAFIVLTGLSKYANVLFGSIVDEDDAAEEFEWVPNTHNQMRISNLTGWDDPKAEVEARDLAMFRLLDINQRCFIFPVDAGYQPVGVANIDHVDWDKLSHLRETGKKRRDSDEAQSARTRQWIQETVGGYVNARAAKGLKP